MGLAFLCPAEFSEPFFTSGRRREPRHSYALVVDVIFIGITKYCLAQAMSSVGRWVLTHTELEAVVHGFLFQL